MNTSRAVMTVLPWVPELPGGVSVVVRSLLREFDRNGVQATLVVSDWRADVPALDSHGRLHFRFAIVGGSGWLQMFRGILKLPMRLSRTVELLRAIQPAAINFHYVNLDGVVVALLKRLGRFDGRLVLSFHGTDVRTPRGAGERALWRFLLASADVVTACSPSLALRIESALGLEASRVVVIANGVDPSVFGPQASLRDVEGLPWRFLVSVGTYVPNKGHLVLLEAFARIAGRFDDLGLVIIGGDGPERARLQARAHDLGIARRLTCLVDLQPKEVSAIVSKAVACVQASFAEAFSLAVIEAGACAVPVIASAVGGHLDLLEAQRTGFLFQVGDVGACADAIEQVLKQPALAYDVAHAWRDVVLDRYTWAHCASGYLSAAGLAD